MASLSFPRRGAWCVVGERVGIIAQYPQVTVTPAAKEGDAPTRATDSSLAEVHYVDAKGLTVEEARDVKVSSIKQATVAQIPKARRPETLDKSLGYHG